MLCASAQQGNRNNLFREIYTMNNNYKAGDLRHTVAAVVCTIVFGSTFLLGAVAPGTAVAAPRVAVTQTAA